jgi:AraC family transcriptional regulator
MGECERFPSGYERYQQRFERVLAHIETHSDQPLSLDAISRLAAFSPHHFQRQFSGFFGMSAHKYAQFMRMRRASWRLAFRADTPVQEIAHAAGYEGPEAFARAFRQFSGQSPSEFRAAPDWAEWHSRFRPFIHLRQTLMSTFTASPVVRVVQFPTTRLGLLEHRGSPLGLGDSVRAFIDWRKANHLSPRSSATFNLVYDDPDDTPPEDFRFGLGAATQRSIEPNAAGVTAFTIPAGRCAVLRHVGSDDHLGRSIAHLYRSWLPASGEELRDFPLFMQRVSFFPDVPDSEAITDIFLPLR